MSSTTLLILLVIFFATLIRSTFGFGEGLVAVPLLALVIPVAVAAPLAVLVSITIAAVVVVQDWRHIHLKSTGWLLVPTLLGIPLGVGLLAGAHPALAKCALGVVIAGFSSYMLLAGRLPHLEEDHRGWLLGCGFLAGVLGGAYGMNGPPLVVYGAMRRWSPQHFRATLQGYFLPASIVAMVGYRLTGLWQPAVTHDYLLSLWVMLPAIWLGRVANRRLRGEVFLRIVHMGLLCVGLLLVVEAVRSL
jgi:uncharacterized membrane protein YfcA